MSYYRTKTVQSNELIEHICFYEPIIYNNKTNNLAGRKGKEVTTIDDELNKIKKSYDNRKETINSNKSYLRRLMIANANQYKECDKFMTLTFKKNSSSINECDREFTNFIKRLKRYTTKSFKYLAVREKQDRGAIHYHCIFYDLPFIKHRILLEIWNKNNSLMLGASKLSGVNIKGIEEGTMIISSYMSKYFLKQLEEDDFLKGRKILLKSRDLIQPKETKSVLSFDELGLNIEDIDYMCTFLDTKVTYVKKKIKK